MEHNMILSASGWRKIFAESGNEEDKTTSIGRTNRALCALIAETFAEFMEESSKSSTGKLTASIAVGCDTRPTGDEIADVILRVLIDSGLDVHYLGVAAAPEIMAYARNIDGFLYISASHNPIGHNGIKFGLNDGGVLPSSKVSLLINSFEEKCAATDALEHAESLIERASQEALDSVLQKKFIRKKAALAVYEDFMRTVITGTNNLSYQDIVFNSIQLTLEERPLSLACDMNGSARTISIDKDFISGCAIEYYAINNEPGKIEHAIIPEPENLIYCANFLNEMQKDGDTSMQLGYMPDCDGDRGNIVYWSEEEQEAKPVPAQEVFALCVLAESAFEIWQQENFPCKGLFSKAKKISNKKAVVVNCPTSMRIDEICKAFNQELFRAEVGEANVVNLARQKRDEGYDVRILGEGSNGGNITYPSCVRDPVATLFALIKLLTLRDTTDSNGTVHKGLFHIWCQVSDQEFLYKEDFTLEDIIKSLPAYKTTGVSESRAVLKVKTKNKGLLKEKFKKIFEEEWYLHQDELFEIYGFTSYQVDITNGTKEVKEADNWNNGNGGLKIRFLDEHNQTKAFIWMRPSGTENVFRILCDTKGEEEAAERSLLRWESSMITKADS